MLVLEARTCPCCGQDEEVEVVYEGPEPAHVQGCKTYLEHLCDEAADVMFNTNMGWFEHYIGLAQFMLPRKGVK